MDFKKYIPLSWFELGLGLSVLILIVLVIAGSRLSRLESGSAITASDPVEIFLTEPVDLQELSAIMVDSSVVQSKEELLWAGRLLGWNRFSTGRYELEGSYSYDSLLSKIARGIQDPVSVTIIPGSTEERIARRIVDTFKFDSTGFYNQLNDTLFLDEMDIERKDLLGRLYPDTYSLYWTSTPEAVVRRILNEFDRSIVESHRIAIEESGRTVNEIVTLASIVEWEATNEDEKDKISGLYWNRLNRGMRLQADPTVNFAVEERRRLLYEDYEVDHPYNTYMNDGLPPGPITNPSYSSIMAALNPAEHDYLFMVASPDGSHVFSKTFEEHQRESAKWRRWIREQYRIKREKEREAEQRPNADTSSPVRPAVLPIHE